MKIQCKDISEMKTFSLYGETFTMVKDYGNDVYLYSRDQGYELIKAKPHKNPDGNVIKKYPGNSEWGSWGYTFIIPEGEKFNRILNKLLNK